MIIQSKIHNYEVVFESDTRFVQSLIERDKTVFVIDRNVHSLFQDLFSGIKETDLIVFDAVETNKNMEGVGALYEILSQREEKRTLTIVSIGGGIVQDVTGFVASTLYRGVNWIFVPTTFLAQADSCVGSKTSLNYGKFKNILGGFYPPHKIHICPEFLATLNEKDFHSGIGEVAKFLLLDDTRQPDVDRIAELVDKLTQREGILEAIHQSLQVKQSYIAQDEFDGGKRNLFNYGHCFGHALESASDYEVPHGIAVTIGMLVANVVAFNRGLVSEAFVNELKTRIFLPIIPFAFKREFFEPGKIIAALKNDKKRVGSFLTMIIPSTDNVNAIKVDDLTDENVIDAMNTAIQDLTLI